MKRLIIVCEGPTEQEFCNEILAPHFLNKNISLTAPIVKKSHGGIVPWISLKMQIVHHLREKDVYVSMLVDFYGIKDNFAFPGWEESKKLNKHDRIHFLIDKMRLDLNDDVRYRFIPYMQLHEFEGLLFCDINAFKSSFTKDEADFISIESTMNEFDSPEDINNSPETAPSKRLIKAIPGYDKILFGNVIASYTGLDTIRKKCHLFDEWLTKLESL